MYRDALADQCLKDLDVDGKGKVLLDQASRPAQEGDPFSSQPNQRPLWRWTLTAPTDRPKVIVTRSIRITINTIILILSITIAVAVIMTKAIFRIIIIIIVILMMMLMIVVMIMIMMMMIMMTIRIVIVSIRSNR